MDKKFFAGAAVTVLLFTLVAAVALDGADTSIGTGEAAVITLDGAISSSGGDAFNPQGVSPSQLRDLNERAVRQGADAIIYEWNSGGGAVVASKDIKREIESVEVPAVCRFRDVAASGAYLASLGCDSIVADSASLTGSIGVRSSYLEYSGLLDKLGIEYVNITSGQLKETGVPYRNTSDQERELLQEKADIVHRDFIDEVKTERNLTAEQLERIETGEVFLGEEAKELSLVDTLGGRSTAIQKAENLTGSELDTFKVEKSPGFNFMSLLNLKSMLSGSGSAPIEASWR